MLLLMLLLNLLTKKKKDPIVYSADKIRVESVMTRCVPFRFEGIRVRPHVRVTLESVNRYGDDHSFRDDHTVYFHVAVRHPDIC